MNAQTFNLWYPMGKNEKYSYKVIPHTQNTTVYIIALQDGTVINTSNKEHAEKLTNHLDTFETAQSWASLPPKTQSLLLTYYQVYFNPLED